MLKKGDAVTLRSGKICTINRLLGSGGQGDVYDVDVAGQPYALKWYLPNQATDEQKKLLENLLRWGPPNARFLWPVDLAIEKDNKELGYIMPLRESRFKSINDLMNRRVEPTFRALCTAGYELANSFLDLHTKGLCYKDISFGNVFFDPETGEVKICDNDNVTVTGKEITGVLGTPRFMAPEIVRGEAYPSTETDLFSLAILLFYMFMLHHPLEGMREFSIRCFDLPAMKKLFGDNPVFIWDPDDNSNRPVQGYQDNPIIYWYIYPQFIKDLFTQVFTTGIHQPQSGRVRESEWRKAFVQLRDCITYCPTCGGENFFDAQINKGKSLCWACNSVMPYPPRIQIENGIVVLNHDSQLFPHHLGGLYDFSAPVAEITRHPQNPLIWGLRNLSQDEWRIVRQDGLESTVPPSKSCILSTLSHIYFGSTVGEIIA